MAEEEKKEEKQEAKTVGRKAYEWLKELGVPAVLAAGLVALVYGVLVWLGVVTLSGCTADYSQMADGSLQYHGTIVLPSK